MDKPRPPVLILPGRERSHEVTLNAYAVLIGLLYALGLPRPPAVTALIGPPWIWIFGVTIGVGGALALTGSFWLSNLERALELERAGLIILSGSLLVYASCVLAFTGPPGAFAAGFAFAWVWANVRRSYQISRDVRHLRRGST